MKINKSKYCSKCGIKISKDKSNLEEKLEEQIKENKKLIARYNELEEKYIKKANDHYNECKKNRKNDDYDDDNNDYDDDEDSYPGINYPGLWYMV